MVPGLPDSAVQLLTPEGERVTHDEYAIDPDDEQLRSLYRDMVMVRRLDAEVTALQRQGEVGLWASSLGQEAAQIGSARCLRPGDFAFPTYRDHGVTWCRGVPTMEVMRMFRGTSTGGWDPEAYGCAIYTIVIGNQVLHAVGYGMGMQLDGAEDAVLVYFGDGATDEGDVNEAFVFAATFNAPVVFLCENNQWAISSPRERHGGSELFQRAAGFGFPGVQVDGNDILAVMAVTESALERARSGGGPTLVEAYTYRMAPHTTSDDPTRYRLDEDLEIWRLRDPVERLKALMARRGIAGQDYFEEVDRQAAALAEEVREGVRAMAAPSPESMFDDVYAEPHRVMERQQRWIRDYEASFLDEVLP